MNQVPTDISKNETLQNNFAMQFRGTRDQTKRDKIAADYANVVKELIKSQQWNNIPSLEAQLPWDNEPATQNGALL